MSGKTDELKGRLKEAAGALIDNKKLRQEGKADQEVGKAEQVGDAKKAFDEANSPLKKAA